MDDFIDKVVIVGVGMIGGSLGMAVKKAFPQIQVIGVARSQEKIALAVKQGAIDWGTNDWREVLHCSRASSGATLVVFAAPVETNLRLLEQLGNFFNEPWFRSEDYIISDVGSVKSDFILACRKICETYGLSSEQFSFVPAHPIAGKEKSGVEAAEPLLFKGKVTVLTPWLTKRERLEALQMGKAIPYEPQLIKDKRFDNADSLPTLVETVDSRNINIVRSVWNGIGSRVFETSAEEHDRILARTSHLPNLVSTLTASVVPVEEHIFTGTGFRDVTRLASGDPTVWTEIFGSNRIALLDALNQLEEKLNQWKHFLQDDDRRSVLTFLQETKKKRDALGS